jgi:hypothetical protein
MEENDKKRLTEWLGLCWHEYRGKPGVDSGWDLCIKCRHHSHYPDKEHRTFTDPQDFFACFEKLVEKGEWQRFYNYGAIKSPFVHAENTMQWLLSRTESGQYRLCVLCAEWLTAQKGVK